MATYVISDIHGYFYRFLDCLAKVNFDPREDRLYILGDVADRGPHSAEMLEWVYHASSAVKLLRGNHEDLMLGSMGEYESLFSRDYFKDEDTLFDFMYNSVWIAWNGGIQTFDYLLGLPKANRKNLLDWINRWPLFYDITVQGRRFILVHAGLAMNGIRMSDDRYSKGLNVDIEIKDFPVQHSQSLLWIRDNWILDSSEVPCDVVFGHTYFGRCCNEIEDLNNWLKEDGKPLIPLKIGDGMCHFGEGLKKHCIDSGRNKMSILRLNDMMEFNSDIEEG